LGPLPWSEGRDGVDWPIPVRQLAGGEGGVAREHQQVMAHLMEGSRGRIGGRKMLVADEQEPAAGVDGVPVALG